MQAYVEFIGHLPQFQYDANRQIAVNLLTGATVRFIKNDDAHHLCVHWPGAEEAVCEVDGGKLALIYIHQAVFLGCGNADEYSAELVRMLLKANEPAN